MSNRAAACFFLTLLALTVTAVRLAVAEDQGAPDLVALRRVVLPADKVLEQLDRVGRGSLVLLPRAEFEARVHQAAAAADAAQHPPRLIEAHYRARIAGSALENGSADWRIANPSKAPGILPIPALNLALTDAQVETGPKKREPAVLGDLRGKGLGLLVRPSKQTTMHLGWTARGEERAGDLHFSLQMPACPVATLDLDLPAERAVMPGEQYLVSGPFDSGRPGRRRWRIAFAGRSVLELVVRAAGSSTAKAVPLLAQLHATQILEPDLLTGEFEFNIEVPQHQVSSLVFLCDPDLQPTDVQAPDLASWKVRDAGSGKPVELTVQFRQPFQSGLVQVHCVAPLPLGKRWTAPTVRLREGLTVSENLMLEVQRDLQLVHWEPGSFRFTQLPTGELFSTQQDRQVLALVRNDLGPGDARPSAELRVGDTELHLRQWSWWQVGPNRSALTVQLGLEMARGRLFQLTFAVPAGWQVIDVGPSDWVRHWSLFRQGGQTILAIELLRPLTRGLTAQALIHLSAGPVPDEAELAFPDLVPRQACFRESMLAIHVDPRYETEPESRLARETEVPVEVEPPWGNQPADYSYRSRELVKPTIPPASAGRLRLRVRHPRFRVHCSERLFFPAGRPALAVELALQPLAGSPSTIDLLVSAPVPLVDPQPSRRLQAAEYLATLASPSPWPALALAAWRHPAPTWAWHAKDRPKHTLLARPNRTLPAMTALQVFAAPPPLGTAATLAIAPQGECWRLTLPGPLSAPLALQTTIELDSQRRAAPGAVQQWVVPLLAVAGAASMDGTVTIEEGALEQQRLDFSGDASGEALHYQDWPARLLISGRLRSRHPFETDVIDRAEWTTWLRLDGTLRHVFRFQVQNWPRRTLPVRLPGEARLLAACADQRWLMTVPALEQVPGAINVPVPSGRGPHTLEIVYQTAASPGRWWTTVPSEPPALPLAPLALQHCWRLPPGMVPLATDNYEQLPGASGVDELAALRCSLAALHHAAETVGGLWLPSSEPADWARRLSQDAAALWKTGPAPGQRWRLRSWLDRLTFRNLRGRVPLIIDDRALAQAGFGPNVLLPAPTAAGSKELWKNLGLAIVTSRSAILLTSRQQFDDWEADGHISAGLPATLAQALAEAAVHGQDRTGRFHALPDWLGRSVPATGEPAGLRKVGLWTDPGGPWTAWQLQPGHEETSALILVRQGGVRVGAWILAIIPLAVWFILRRWGGRVRLLFHLSWVGCAGLALLWLPAALAPLAGWSALVAVVLFLGWYGAFLLSAVRVRGVAPAALAMGLLAASLAGHAEPLKPRTVFVLPASSPGGKAMVLVPPSVLDDLRALASRGPNSLDRAVLLGARYEGTADDSGAELRAEFAVYAFADAPRSLTLPLGGVQLQEARVDGEIAHPTTVPAPREGYQFELKGTGRHAVVVRFHVPVTVDGAGRELRFTGPELARSQLNMILPAAARYAKAVGARGAQRSESIDAGTQLEADLGRTGILRVRWRQVAGQETATLRVREGYLWELRPAGSNLVAVLQYTVTRGAATTLAVRLPEAMEVRRVDVGRLPDASSDDLPPRYRSWTVTGQRLKVQLQAPLTHGAQLTLTLVPSRPLGATPRLLVPTPLDAEPMAEPGAEPLLAYRVDGAVARLTDNLGVSRQDDRTSFQELWWDAGQSDPGSDIDVFAFQRGSGAAPYLQLAVTTPAPIVSCRQNLTWQVSPEKAEVTVLAELKAAERSLALVEWEVGDLTVAEISGPNVRGWRQRGRQVQVWLQHPVAQTTLRLTGWRQGNSPATDFHLTPLPILAAATTTAVIELRTRGNLELVPQSLSHLHAVAKTLSAAQPRYRADQADYAGVFRLHPPQPRAQVDTLTTAELRNGKVAVEVLMTCRPRNEDQHLTVSLWHVGPAEVGLDAPGMTAQPATPALAGGRSWTLTVPASAAAQHWRLHAVLIPEPAVELILPKVAVDGAAAMESWVALVGPELRAVQHTFLAAVPMPARALPHWPQWQRFRPGSTVWKVTRSDWHLALRPHLTVAGSGPIRLFLDEQTARVVDGRHWLHEADCLLYHESDTGLSITLPGGARLVEASVDGQPSPTAEPQAGVVRVSLTGRWGVRRLHLRWQFADADEPLERPILARPRLAGITDGPAFWTVYAPTGFLMTTGAGTAEARPANAVDADLARAEAELELSSVLAQGLALDSERFTRGLRASQERFAWFCAQADRHLQGKVTRDNRLSQLRQRNRRLAETRGFEAVREHAENAIVQHAPTGLPVAVEALGLPYRWTGPSEAAPPALHFIARSIEQQERAAALSLVLIAALVVISVLWHLPGADVWARWLWPEQLALVGLGGWLWAPAGWAFLLLLLVGMVARLSQTAMQLGGMLRARWGKTQTGSNVSSAS